MAEVEASPLRSEIEREIVDGAEIATVAFEGDLDLPVVDQFRTALSRDGLGDTHGVIVDLTGIRFIDSSGIHTLVKTCAALSESGQRVEVVVEGGSNVEHVLQLTGVLDELGPASDRDAAREAIAGKG